MGEEANSFNRGNEQLLPPARSFNTAFSNDAQYDSLVKVWQAIRASVGTFDTLVMSLLTQGTILVFAAFGVVLGSARALGPTVTAGLSTGLFLGVLMLYLGVWRYTSSIRNTVKSALSIENRLFGTDPDDPRRLTHILADHPLAARRGGLLYYRLWALAIVLSALTVAAWQFQVAAFSGLQDIPELRSRVGEHVVVHFTRSVPPKIDELSPAGGTPLNLVSVSVTGKFTAVTGDWIIVNTEEREFAIQKDKVMMLEFQHARPIASPR